MMGEPEVQYDSDPVRKAMQRFYAKLAEVQARERESLTPAVEDRPQVRQEDDHHGL